MRSLSTAVDPSNRPSITPSYVHHSFPANFETGWHSRPESSFICAFHPKIAWSLQVQNNHSPNIFLIPAIIIMCVLRPVTFDRCE